jgi:hypothetical protein
MGSTRTYMVYCITSFDTTLAAVGSRIEEIENILSTDVKHTSQWCNNNDMVVSIPKSSSMIVASRQKLVHTYRSQEHVSLEIKLDGNVIPCVTKTKILGVHVDNVLSWADHIKHVRNKITSNLYLLKQIKAFLPLDARILFYNSYVLPHFDYCCTIWGNCTQTLMKDLVKLQKRAARIILDKDYNTRSKELFCELNWMPIEDRITFQRSLQVFKCINGMCSQGLDEIFEYANNIHSHSTRAAQSNNLYISQQHKRCFSYLGATTWNNIPASIRSATTLAGFKRLYMQNYFAENGF